MRKEIHEFTFESEDGEEMLSIYTKEKYNSKLDNIDKDDLSFNNKEFDPEDKIFIITSKDGTEYHFGTNKKISKISKISKIVDDGVTEYVYEYNSDNEISRVKAWKRTYVKDTLKKPKQ